MEIKRPDGYPDLSLTFTPTGKAKDPGGGPRFRAYFGRTAVARAAMIRGLHADASGNIPEDAGAEDPFDWEGWIAAATLPAVIRDAQAVIARGSNLYSAFFVVDEGEDCLGVEIVAASWVPESLEG